MGHETNLSRDIIFGGDGREKNKGSGGSFLLIQHCRSYETGEDKVAGRSVRKKISPPYLETVAIWGLGGNSERKTRRKKKKRRLVR